MDITVSLKSDGETWALTDLLGRSMGAVVRSGNEFTIVPEGRALETMETIKRGRFSSLDDALAEIERHTRGTCRFDGSREMTAFPADVFDASNDERGSSPSGAQN